MFKGSGILTQAMSPKLSEKEQQNGLEGKHTFQKLLPPFFFCFNEMNFTADKGEIRQYYVQQAFHPEGF